MKSNDLLFIVAIVGLGIVALLSGGGSGGGLFSSQSGNGSQTNGNLNEQQIGQELNKVERDVSQVAKDVKTLEENKNASVYKGMIDLQSISHSYNNDPANEYIHITASSQNKKNIKITNWTLRSISTGNSISIGKGTYLFFGDGQDRSTTQDILMTPGDIAYINTGRSPLGVSFKTNICSGYHNQFLQFNPYLSTNCPLARNEKNNIPPTVKNDSCFDMLDNFPQCRIQTASFPIGTSPECSNFITKTMNYRACVDLHRNDIGFYKNEWRIYLERSDSLWKTRRETVELIDELGKIVDSYSY